MFRLVLCSSPLRASLRFIANTTDITAGSKMPSHPILPSISLLSGLGMLYSAIRSELWSTQDLAQIWARHVPFSRVIASILDNWNLALTKMGFQLV